MCAATRMESNLAKQMRGPRRRSLVLQAGPCAAFLICLSLGGLDPVMAWRKSQRCNMTMEFECKTGHCISVDQVCNRHPDCMDGSDESDCHCVQTWLPPMHRCRNKKCVDNFYTCNGNDDCGDGGSDEENCACYGFRCADGTCILSTWRCDGVQDCKDQSDEESCGSLLTGDRRHPFFGLIGPVGCLVAALSIRVLLRSHHRRRLLLSNGETAAAAAAAAAYEARSRRARFPADDGEAGGALDRREESLEAGAGGTGAGGHWMDRVGAGISSSLAQMRVLIQGQPTASLPPPPPYTETSTLTDLPPAYQHGASAAPPGGPSVYLLVIPAGKPPPTYNESMSLPDLVQSTGTTNQRSADTPLDHHFDPLMIDAPCTSTGGATTDFVNVSLSADSDHDPGHPSAGVPFTTLATSSPPNSSTPPNASYPDAMGFGHAALLASSMDPTSGPSSSSSDVALPSTDEAAYPCASLTTSSSSPLRVVFQRDSGVTLQQNPFSPDAALPADVNATLSRHDEELPPPYDYIFSDGMGGAEASDMVSPEPLRASVDDEEETGSSPADLTRTGSGFDI